MKKDKWGEVGAGWFFTSTNKIHGEMFQGWCGEVGVVVMME